MIKKIDWEEIKHIWTNYLWVNRTSPIESNSAMNFLGGYCQFNMNTIPTFFGYVINGKIVGVNSGHMCESNQYRLRGVYVSEKYRNKGIATELIIAVINQARLENASMIWCIPRNTSWNIYQRLGFKLSSDWFKTETSDHNAYCYLQL